jgi:hypothetical protein
MNDFTKLELIALEDAMENMLRLHTPQSGESPLLKKLQLMIDTYCEHPCKHESDGSIYTSNPPQNKCKKCGEFYR